LNADADAITALLFNDLACTELCSSGAHV